MTDTRFNLMMGAAGLLVLGMILFIFLGLPHKANGSTWDNPSLTATTFNIGSDSKNKNKLIVFMAPNPRGSGYQDIPCIVYTDQGGSSNSRDRWGTSTMTCGW